MTGLIIFLIILAVIIFAVVFNIRIVPQAQVYVIERLGVYHATWESGLHIKIPIIDKVCRIVSLKEQLSDFPPQPVITKDNVTIKIDSVIYYKIVNPKLYAYGVENPVLAMEKLTATTLRNLIGEQELDSTLTSRDIINDKMRAILDEATDVWGIKVNRVELQNIDPPAAIKDAMEKQMKAERERRAKILDAEGEKRSQILIAEGHKEAAILNAEAIKEAKIKEAEGEATAILAVQKAYADSVKVLNESRPSKAVIKIKSLEAFEKVADGKATKIIIPSEIQSMTGLLTGLKEAVNSEEIS